MRRCDVSYHYISLVSLPMFAEHVTHQWSVHWGTEAWIQTHLLGYIAMLGLYILSRFSRLPPSGSVSTTAGQWVKRPILCVRRLQVNRPCADRGLYPNVISMLSQSWRCWLSIETALGEFPPLESKSTNCTRSPPAPIGLQAQTYSVEFNSFDLQYSHRAS